MYTETDMTSQQSYNRGVSGLLTSNVSARNPDFISENLFNLSEKTTRRKDRPIQFEMLQHILRTVKPILRSDATALN
jgi:hypothetical protein